MFYELVRDLTKDQIHQLEDLGVHHTRVSEWKHKKRLPTRQQAVCLAAVTGYNIDDLQAELTVLEAKGETVEIMRRLLGKLRAAGVAATVTLTLLTSLLMGIPTESQAHDPGGSLTSVSASTKAAFGRLFCFGAPSMGAAERTLVVWRHAGKHHSDYAPLRLIEEVCSPIPRQALPTRKPYIRAIPGLSLKRLSYT